MTDVLDRLEVLDPFTAPPQPQPTKRHERFDPSPAALRIAASLSIAIGLSVSAFESAGSFRFDRRRP